MFKKTFVALSLSILPSTGYAASSQFDLVCAVNSHWVDANGWDELGHNGKYALHIDLLHNEWCEGHCDNVNKIATVDSHNLKLVKSDDDDFVVDRDNGRLYRKRRVNNGPNAIYRLGSILGTCHTAPFWTTDVRP